MRLAAILAHEGGWDEILLVGGPILVIVGLLTVVKRCVDSQMPPDPGEPQPDDEPIGDTGSDTGG